MAATGDWFTYGLYHALKGEYDVTTDTIKVMLTTASYTPNKNMHEYREDVTNEVSGTGYVAATLGNPVLSVVSNVVVLDGDDISWSITGSLTARYAVVYVDTGSPATDILLGYVDLDGDKTATDGAFNFNINASGLMTLTN